MVKQKEFSLEGKPRGFHLITDEIGKHLPELPPEGILHLFIKHTSAALALNENAAPGVRQDLESIFNKLIKENEPYYKHTSEGPDDMPAHAKSLLIGTHLTIPITNHLLNLGIWQGIYLCEFRNSAKRRSLVATILY